MSHRKNPLHTLVRGGERLCWPVEGGNGRTGHGVVSGRCLYFVYRPLESQVNTSRNRPT